MSTRLIAGRLLCPLLLLVLVVVQFSVGGNALPTWLSVLAQKNGQDPLSYLKLLVMVEFSVAIVILLLGQRISAVGSDLLGGISFPWTAWILLALLPLAGAGLATLVARYTMVGALRKML